MACSKNQEWNHQFDVFEYFIITNDAVVGVISETNKEVVGWIICSKSGVNVDTTIKLNKQKVVKSLHADALEIVHTPPEWFYTYNGFSKN